MFCMYAKYFIGFNKPFISNKVSRFCSKLSRKWNSNDYVICLDRRKRFPVRSGFTIFMAALMALLCLIYWLIIVLIEKKILQFVWRSETNYVTVVIYVSHDLLFVRSLTGARFNGFEVS